MKRSSRWVPDGDIYIFCDGDIQISMKISGCADRSQSCGSYLLFLGSFVQEDRVGPVMPQTGRTLVPLLAVILS